MAIPKALEPTGLILVDKPAGPSSFAVLAGVRGRTGAKTGHAGTLDPFATGLLLLLSGQATRIASCFVGLPKRYLTDIDLSGRTTTGDPEGERLESHDVPSAEALHAALVRLRGDVELPIPAASAVKIGGERAYRLHRKGVVVEMPLRRSRVDALDVIAYIDGIATLDLQVSSGTYVRSIADALGGHCVTLRRTEVGPFSVREADAERIVPLDEALGRIGLTVADAAAERARRAASDREAQADRKALGDRDAKGDRGAWGDREARGGREVKAVRGIESEREGDATRQAKAVHDAEADREVGADSEPRGGSAGERSGASRRQDAGPDTVPDDMGSRP